MARGCNELEGINSWKVGEGELSETEGPRDLFASPNEVFDLLVVIVRLVDPGNVLLLLGDTAVKLHWTKMNKSSNK